MNPSVWWIFAPVLSSVILQLIWLVEFCLLPKSPNHMHLALDKESLAKGKTKRLRQKFKKIFTSKAWSATPPSVLLITLKIIHCRGNQQGCPMLIHVSLGLPRAPMECWEIFRFGVWDSWRYFFKTCTLNLSWLPEFCRAVLFPSKWAFKVVFSPLREFEPSY